MRQTKLFTKTRREAPKDEVAKNANLLIRAGYIHKEMAGVYAYLPLGLRVLKNIENIIREEMNAIGGQELLMTTLQDSAIWEKTGRWSDAKVDNWFKTHLHEGESFHTGKELGVANTHEEPITDLLAEFVNSYKDMPIYVYQFQTKFRNELRAKSGIMRVREFVMKDLYSFSQSEEEFKEFYEQCAQAYLKIFKRVGLGDITYRTIAAGGSFTKNLTDEFQTVSSAGEDTIYIDEEKNIAINKEVYNDETIKRFGLNKDKLKEAKSIEVGNIFPYGTQYPEIFGLKYKDENGKEKFPIMGAYGIGLGRLMGTVVEVLSDESGIVWPESIAPYKIHLLSLLGGEQKSEEIYNLLSKSGKNVLFDDREAPAGQKFADADLMGMPFRIVVSGKTVSAGKYEVKNRATGEIKMMSEEEVLKI